MEGGRERERELLVTAGGLLMGRSLYILSVGYQASARAPSKIQIVERNEHLEWLEMHRPPICLNLLEAAQSICRSTYSFESSGNGPRNKRANKDWSDAIYLLHCSREERKYPFLPSSPSPPAASFFRSTASAK